MSTLGDAANQARENQEAGEPLGAASQGVGSSQDTGAIDETLTSGADRAAFEVEAEEGIASAVVLPAALLGAQSVLSDDTDHARIRALELALDETLVAIQDLRQQVGDQRFLEEQLANTEEFSQLQQQAITELRTKLGKQTQAQELTQQRLEQAQQTQHWLLQGVLTEAEELTLAQRGNLDRLRRQLRQDRADLLLYQTQLEQQVSNLRDSLAQQQQRIEDLESQGLTARSQVISLEAQGQAAQQHVEQLQTLLQQRRMAIADLQGQLEHNRTTLQAQQELNIAQTQIINQLQQDLGTAQRKAEELATQLDRQTRLQARLQQHFLEMETERNQMQERLKILDHQIIEMQEQILQQAQQRNEYETAIQHWKNRYFSSQQKLAQLQQILMVQRSQLSPELFHFLILLEAEAGEGTLDTFAENTSVKAIEKSTLIATEKPTEKPGETILTKQSNTSDSSSQDLNDPSHSGSEKETRVDLPNFVARRPN